MKAVSILFLTLALSALFAVAADQPQPPAAGSQAPAFSLPSQEGAQVSLDQFRGKWVVLYFYPKDFTRAAPSKRTISSATSINTQRRMPQSSASAWTTWILTKSFCAKEGLNFKLLADSDHAVVQKYGSIMEYNGMTLAARNTFLIDPTG